jgi:predicted nucleic acid-binding protein
MGRRPRGDARQSGHLIMIDSSAWIEFLRGSEGPIRDVVRRLLAEDAVMTCDPVRMEILAGARDDAHLSSLRRLLARAQTASTGPSDFEEAAILYRTCRRNGETVRKLIDCLIASVAIREGAEVLHADADFDILARHTALRVQSPSAPGGQR